MITYVTLIYSLLIMAAAIKGSMQGSFISLFAGGFFSLLLMGSAGALYFQKKAGLYLALAATLCMAVVFFIRYAKGHSPLHAVLTILSGVMLCYFFLQLSKGKKASMENQ